MRYLPLFATVAEHLFFSDYSKNYSGTFAPRLSCGPLGMVYGNNGTISIFHSFCDHALTFGFDFY
jgi:hypothetical protein